MIRWYVTYWAKTCDGKSTFGYIIATTVQEYFPIRQVVEKVESENSYTECTLLNWKKISEVEYLHHEGKFGERTV